MRNRYHNNINLVHHSIEAKKRTAKKRGFFYKIIKFAVWALVAFFIISFLMSSRVIFSQQNLSRAISKLPVVSQIRTIFGADDELHGQDNDRVNFLLMGIGGIGHEGPLLTDTMILGSIQLSTKQVALISVPRDLLVKIPDNGWQRINHANAYGEINNYPQGGSALAAQVFTETFGIPIDYWLRVDFSGFVSAIDDLGGIDVYVDHSFTDNQFPTNDFKVQTISFQQGVEHMGGERALQFARSRHGDNGEGSDFARSKRQQKILLAIKDKILNWKTLANPNRIYKIYNNIKNNIQTNIEVDQLLEFIALAREINFDEIQHRIIDDSPGGLLKAIITEDGAQVLAPKTGDLSELRDFAKNIFVVKSIMDNETKIIIANGTHIEGLATYIGGTLGSWGFTIERLINSPQQNFEKTVIYPLGNDQNKNSENAVTILKKRMGANMAEKIPDFLQPVLYENNGTEKISADFLIVVGEDQVRAIAELAKWQEEQAKIKKLAEQVEKKNKLPTESAEEN